MVKFFEITRGMPMPLVVGALEMFFSQQGGGGRVGFAPASSRRNIVAIDHDTVAGLFRSHLQRANAHFTESSQAPQGIAVALVLLPTREELMQEALRAEFARMITRVASKQRRRRRP
jgi:hypothetical protein